MRGKRILTLFLALLFLAGSACLPLPGGPGGAVAMAASTQTGVVTASQLNLRATASTKGKVLAVIAKGKTVQILSTSKGWHRVKYGSKTGYVSTDYIKKTTAAKSASGASSSTYVIRVDTGRQVVGVYKKDSAGKYNTPVKFMVCSTSRVPGETPLGNHKTSQKVRWHQLIGNSVYGQYCTRYGPNLMFHSVPCQTKGKPDSVYTHMYNQLGTAASSGCIRLTVADAKWLYDKVPLGTKVEIRKNANWPKMPSSVKAPQIPNGVRWDPTDPDPRNPYQQKLKIGTKSGSGVPTASLLNVRRSASTSAKVVTAIPLNVPFEITGKTGDWYKVKFQGKTGYVLAKHVKVTKKLPVAKPTVKDPAVQQFSVDFRKGEQLVVKTRIVTEKPVNAYLIVQRQGVRVALIKQRVTAKNSVVTFKWDGTAGYTDAAMKAYKGELVHQNNIGVHYSVRISVDYEGGNVKTDKALFQTKNKK